MKLVTAEQMRTLDAAAIAGGIPGAELMERAGRGLAEAVRRLVSTPAPIGILLGAGNNAGDGLVAARYLADWGYPITLFTTKARETWRPHAQANFARLIPGSFTARDALTARCEDFARCACVIDALFGIGVTHAIHDPVRSCIERLNQSGVRIVAADIPSGLSADTGESMGIAVRATATVTFGLPKLGLVIGSGPIYTGRIEIIDLQIPSSLIAAIDAVATLNHPTLFMPYWPTRPPQAHKGTFGHALVVAGSSGMIGAGFLTSKAVLRVGAGLVTYALAEAAYQKFDPHTPEVMVAALPDGGLGYVSAISQAALQAQLAKKNAVAIGPGLGRAPDTITLVRALLPDLPVPSVIDADALYAIADDPSLLRHRAAEFVLTPHPGEMSALCGEPIAAITADPLRVARDFAQTYGVQVVLKGHRTIMASPDGAVVINPTGNSGMATAGAGDVLTGVITGLLAQGMPFPAAMHAGVYLHGLAGNLVAAEQGESGMVASDIIEALPKAQQLLHMAGHTI